MLLVIMCVHMPRGMLLVIMCVHMPRGMLLVIMCVHMPRGMLPGASSGFRVHVSIMTRCQSLLFASRLWTQTLVLPIFSHELWNHILIPSIIFFNKLHLQSMRWHGFFQSFAFVWRRHEVGAPVWLHVGRIAATPKWRQHKAKRDGQVWSAI